MFRFFSDFGWGESGDSNPGTDDWGFKEPSSRRRSDDSAAAENVPRRRADEIVPRRRADDTTAVAEEPLPLPTRRMRLEEGQAQPRRISGFGQSDSQLYNRYLLRHSMYAFL